MFTGCSPSPKSDPGAISKLKNTIDLINLYAEKDQNKDLELKAGEIPKAEVKKHDKNKDHALSPWEVMEAANKYNSKPVFIKEQIDLMKKANDKGRFFHKQTTIYFDPVNKGEVTVRGISFLKHYGVSFYENGMITSGVLADDTEIKGIEYMENSRLQFYENGQVERGYLADDTTIQDIEYAESTAVSFHENGKLSYGVLAEETTVQGNKFYEDSGLEFDKAGRLKTALLPKYKKGSFKLRLGLPYYPDTILQGIKFKAATAVKFHENGRVSEGSLAKNTILQGKTLKAGTLIKFDSSGQLQE
ncbi:MAG: hypothetical protein V3T21_01040 [Candidatus Margulisiibacteriota bacterium]